MLLEQLHREENEIEYENIEPGKKTIFIRDYHNDKRIIRVYQGDQTVILYREWIEKLLPKLIDRWNID